MGRIDDSHLVSARAKVAAMDLATKERSADEIYRHQPNLLASVLALHKSGVSMPELDGMLNILFVCYQAMIESGKAWPVITLPDQEKHLARLTAQIKLLKDWRPCYSNKHSRTGSMHIPGNGYWRSCSMKLARRDGRGFVQTRKNSSSWADQVKSAND